jgi:hypothetical protein
MTQPQGRGWVIISQPGACASNRVRAIHERFLVALPTSGDLFIYAKVLLVEANGA